MPVKSDTATFGAGCFWCVEAIFSQLKGVISVVPGYCGGNLLNPTYEQVCTGKTGHAEVAQIVYNPAEISYEELLQVFWQVHDPTTLNRQGNDTGTQYRSVIFYHNNFQMEVAMKLKKTLDESGAFEMPVVTEIEKYSNFFYAEDYHREYYNKNPENSYCTFVITPKIEKFRKVYRGKLK